MYATVGGSRAYEVDPSADYSSRPLYLFVTEFEYGHQYFMGRIGLLIHRRSNTGYVPWCPAYPLDIYDTDSEASLVPEDDDFAYTDYDMFYGGQEEEEEEVVDTINHPIFAFDF